MGLFDSLGAGAGFAQAMTYMGVVGNAVAAFNKYKHDSDESELFEAIANTIISVANMNGIKKPLSDAQFALLTGHIAGIIDLFEKD